MNGDTTPAPIALAAAPALPEGGVWLLLQIRFRMLANRVRAGMRHQPLRLLGTAGSISLIWFGLYILLVQTFLLIRRSTLEGIVATPLIFTFFFLALTGMLAFSSAILSYGSLFRRGESAYLLATPLNPLHIVTVKYLESLVLSSWSLVLLGLPLMMAMARIFDESWSFYPLFLGLFLLFIPMPGALGLVLAWLVAVVFPRTPRRMLVMLCAFLLFGAGWWGWRVLSAPIVSSEWLKLFYDRVALVQSAMLPHTWVSKGINHAVQNQSGPALFYLLVTAANALLSSLVAVGVVARGYALAFDRGQTSGARGVRRTGWLISWIGEVLFSYMPWRQRLLSAKDLKTFFRDPMQWSQMAILIGLLTLYVSNVQRLWVDLAEPRLQLLIAFLNLTAVSLILATFTNRFLFPLVSLDGQQLWLLGLLPLRRSGIVVAKFYYSLTLTLLAAMGVMSVSIWRLELPRAIAFAHLVASAATCIGLCGVSIGMGARLPVFQERNPARIAGGFGGTVSLLVSVGLVVASLAGVGMMTFSAARETLGDSFTVSMAWWLAAVVCVNLVAAAVSMSIGIRHFSRVEW